jgi:hypothetical protein
VPITSIPVNDRIDRFTASGGQTVFAYDFPVYAASDLEVRRVRADVETTLALGADYTVTGAGAQPGGTVVLTAAAAAGDIVTIRSAQPDTRATDFADGGDLPADSLDAELNRIAVSLQQHSTRIDQALRFPVTDATTPAMPPARLRANRVLGFDSNGAPLMLLASPPVIAPGTLTIDARAYVTMGASSDQSAGLQAAINAAAAAATVSYGGLAQVDLPGGYLRLDNSVTLPSFVSLAGRGPQATFIDLYAAAQINVGTPAPAGATRSQTIRDLYISGTNKTLGTGYAINVSNAYNVLIQRVQVENVEFGINVQERTNNVTMSNFIVVANRGTAPVGLRWRGGATSADRSDAFNLSGGVITGQWANATLILWEGLAHTFDINQVYLLQAVTGLHVRRGPGAGLSDAPAFLTARNLQCEGFKTRCAHMESGVGVYTFVSCHFDVQTSTVGSQGNADEEAVLLAGDTGATITRSVRFVGCRFGLTRKEGLVIGARDVQVIAPQFVSTSQAGSGLFSAMRVAGTAEDIEICAARADEFGGAGLAASLLRLDSGARRVRAVGLNAAYCVTSAINDQSGRTDNEFYGVTEPTAVPYFMSRAAPGAQTEAVIRNGSNANASRARIVLQTGVTNGQLTVEAVNTSTSQAVAQIVANSGVTALDKYVPIERTVIGGVYQHSVGALLPSFANDAAAAAGGIVVGGWYYDTTLTRERQRRV